MFGARLKELREAKKITQRLLAEKLGVTQQAVAKWENSQSEPDTQSIVKLASLLDTTPNYLMGVYVERERIKREARSTLYSTSSLEDKVEAARLLFKQYFIRSLEAVDFDDRHPELDDFIAMLLNQEFTKEELPSDVYKKMVEIYGTQEGILEGSSYYDIPIDPVVLRPRELPQTVAPYLPEGFDELSPEAKKEVLDYIDYIMVKYGKKENK